MRRHWWLPPARQVVAGISSPEGIVFSFLPLSAYADPQNPSPTSAQHQKYRHIKKKKQPIPPHNTRMSWFLSQKSNIGCLRELGSSFGTQSVKFSLQLCLIIICYQVRFSWAFLLSRKTLKRYKVFNKAQFNIRQTLLSWYQNFGSIPIPGCCFHGSTAPLWNLWTPNLWTLILSVYIVLPQH